MNKSLVPLFGSRLPSIRNDLFGQLDSFFERSFDDFFSGFDSSEFPVIQSIHKSAFPRVDVYDNENDVTLEAAVPGLTKEDITVEFKDDILTLSGNRVEEKEDKKKNRVYKELHKSSFSRSFTVPETEYDTSKIDGKLENGVLTLVIPRKEPKKIQKEVSRKIELK